MNNCRPTIRPTIPDYHEPSNREFTGKTLASHRPDFSHPGSEPAFTLVNH